MKIFYIQRFVINECVMYYIGFSLVINKVEVSDKSGKNFLFLSPFLKDDVCVKKKYLKKIVIL